MRKLWIAFALLRISVAAGCGGSGDDESDEPLSQSIGKECGSSDKTYVHISNRPA
jgi:hypothetical protein